MESVSEHYIVCGFSRIGRQIAAEFQAEGIPFVTIELEPESLKLAQNLGYMTVYGDATSDETLLAARIDRAICLVAALPKDAENLYIVLSAKTLNPEIRVIARASSQDAMQKLERAGADAVVSPYITGGKHMAAAALRPQVVDFVDGILTGSNRELYMEEFRLDEAVCPCVGQTLGEVKPRAKTGALVVALRRTDGTLIGGPAPETELREGDLLICMGTSEQLRQLNQIWEPIHSRPWRSRSNRRSS